jgi:TPR repeat protein
MSAFAPVRWFIKGAEAGDSFAMTNLGFMYEKGRGLARNVAEAVSWYRKVAALNDEFAKTAVQRLEPPPSNTASTPAPK